MERKRALLVSTIVAATMMTGAVAFAASSGLTDNRRDNVGQLQPTGTLPPTITVIVDPATGAASVAPATVDAGSRADTASANTRHERDEDEDEDDD